MHVSTASDLPAFPRLTRRWIFCVTKTYYSWLIYIGQGSGGGPDEDNVTGLLVRSLAKKWAKGSVLAVDAGIHLASIARILEAERGIVSGRSSEEAPAKEPHPRKAIREEESDQTNTSNGTKRNYSISVLDAFGGLQLPHQSSRANAAYVTRELVSTYLITHPHLDHISGFVINTASFQHTSRPKRLAALSTTIDAIKTHIFNDVIWPNMVSPSCFFFWF